MRENITERFKLEKRKRNAMQAITKSYRDLPIHQRINAKGNSLVLNRHYYRVMQICGKLLAKVSKRDGGTFCPEDLLVARNASRFDLKRNQPFA